MERIRSSIWTDQLVKTGYRPPHDLVTMLEQTFPTVTLAWAPDIERWSLWDQNGGELQLICALTEPDGSYAHPNLDNTVHFLQEHSLAGIESVHEMMEFLGELDAKGDAGVAEQERQSNEAIHEGSERLYHAFARNPFITKNPVVGVR